MIDRAKISPPQVSLAPEAAAQIRLIFQHDHTLQGKCVRLHIDGKGCDGFRYALGMGQALPGDFIVEAQGIAVHLDPFCAFYLQTAQVDYVVLASGEDGFTVTNPVQERYQGKFWKDHQELIPPQVTTHAPDGTEGKAIDQISGEDSRV